MANWWGSICRGRPLTVALGVVLMLAGPTGPALAQQPPAASPELISFMNRPEQQRLYGAAMNQQWQNAVANCPSLPNTHDFSVLVEEMPRFNADGQPVSGQWRVIGWFEGCGHKRLMNVLYTFGPDRKLTRIALLPGTSVADAILQRDSVQYAAAAMTKLAPKDCNDVRISDTRFVAFDGAGTPRVVTPGKTPWTEEWTVRACGVSALVPMHFTPTPKGMTITSHMADHKIEP